MAKSQLPESKRLALRIITYFAPKFRCGGRAALLPQCLILVLYGRIHGGGEFQVQENLRVLTAPAEYPPWFLTEL